MSLLLGSHRSTMEADAAYCFAIVRKERKGRVFI